MMQPNWPSDAPNDTDAGHDGRRGPRRAPGRAHLPVLAVGRRWRPAPGARARARAPRASVSTPGCSRPSDGPPPEAGHHEPRADARLPVERVDRTDHRGQGGRGPDARGAPRVPPRRACTCTSRCRRARTTRRSSAPTSPRSARSTPRTRGATGGTTRSASRCAKMVDRLAVRTAVSEEAQRNVEATFGGTLRDPAERVDVEAFAEADAVAGAASRDRVRRSPRASQGPRRAARRVRRRSIVTPTCGSPGERPRDGRARAPARSRPSTWLGRITEAEKARRLRGATIACFPSIEGESFGVVLLEAMAAGTADRRVRSHRVPPRRARRPRGRARASPATRPRCATRSGASSTTPALRRAR